MKSEIKTISPIDGGICVRRDCATAAEIAAALTRAKNASPAWARRPLAERAALLTKAVDFVVSRKAQIAEELTRQMGRPLRYTPGEVNGFEERARHMIALAPEALADIVPPAKEGFVRYIKREPVGTVLVIAPWNYPFLTAVNAIIPALLAGNTVLLKHSAQTPLVAERFAEAFAHAGLPEGVFQYLHTTHEDTLRLVKAPEVNFVCCTGSVAVGAMVEQAAAGRFIGVGLELGGNDPAYVRADADLGLAVDQVVDGAFFNSGQSCCGIQRVYVHRSLYEEFITRAAALTRQYVLGNPLDGATTLGPVVRVSAAEEIRTVVTEALALGARGLIDPALFPLDRPGTPYVAPQILVNVDHRMKIMADECFGPVCGVMPVTDDDEAIRLMNDSLYGLSAALFTRDLDAARSIGDRLETGTVFMNRCDYLDPALAWTGVKNTGRGCTLSRVGFEHLTRPKSYHLRTKW